MFDLENDELTLKASLRKTVLTEDEVEYTDAEDESLVVARAVRVEPDSWVLAFSEEADLFPEHILMGVVGGHRAFSTELQCRLAAELVYSING